MGESKETGINVKKMSENVGLKENEYLSLLELFVETSISYVSELKSAIHDGDSKRVYETIHNIRGAAENLGIPEMPEIAWQMELKARQNILEGAEKATEFLAKRLEYLREIFH